MNISILASDRWIFFSWNTCQVHIFFLKQWLLDFRQNHTFAADDLAAYLCSQQVLSVVHYLSESVYRFCP